MKQISMSLLVIIFLLLTSCKVDNLGIKSNELFTMFRIKDKPTDVSFIYSGNMEGELEPCGCTPDTDFGGVLRHSTGLSQLKQQFPDAFTLAAGGLLDTNSITQKIKNEFILQGIKSMAYDAIGLQWRDLEFGEDLLQKYTLPWVASNYPRQNFSSRLEITHKNKRAAVFSLLDPSGFNLMTDREEFHKLTDEFLSKIKQSRSQGRVTVVILSPKMQNWLANLQDQVDFVILPTGAENFEAPRALTPKTWLLQPSRRGMYLGAANFVSTEKGEWQLQRSEILPLAATIANDVKLQPWYDQYNEALRTAYQEEVALKKNTLANSPYVGAVACQSCHQSAFTVWQNSAHAHALDKLKAVNKAFDPECVNCHVVGLQQTGGFIDAVTTPHLANVQCENCHGPRREHVNQPLKNKSVVSHPNETPADAVCLTCHNAEHSPKFDFKTYWPQINHQ